MKTLGCMLFMLPRRLVTDKSTQIRDRGLFQNMAESEFSKIGKKSVFIL
jgi:hypothetical protein